MNFEFIIGCRAPQAATALKVIGNLFIFNVETVAEAHIPAEKSGLGGSRTTFVPSTILPRRLYVLFTSHYWNEASYYDSTLG